MTEHFGDARLEELKLLAELDRRGGLTVTPMEGPQRDMILFLVHERFVTAFKLPWRDTGIHVTDGFPGESPLERHLHECWVKSLSDVLTGQSAHLELTHKGRVRLSELKQAMRTGRIREPFGILWDARHLENDLQISILDASEDLPLSLGYLDMNGLKEINDKIGHDAGSLALRAYFHAVATALADKAEAYRSGGDEVIVILPSQGLEEAKCTLRKVCLLLMQEVLEFGGRSLPRVSLSVGIVTTTDARVKFTELRESAERAMYRAKAVTQKSTPHPSAIAGAEGDVSIVIFGPQAP